MRRLCRYFKSGILHQPLLQDAKQEEKCEGKNPFYTATFFSRLCFSWLNPLLGLGYTKCLEKSDIPPLDQADGAAMACNTFMAIWSEEKKLGHSISTALIRCHMKYFIWTGICALLHTLSLSLSPILLFLFIDFASKTVHLKYEGYVLVLSVFLCKLTEAISQRHWYFGSRQIGLRIRSVLIAAVSCKVLALSTTARQRRSEGEVVSYISVDAYQLGELPWWLHQVWTVPLQIIIALIILFSLVGWAATPGLVVILVTAAIQTPLARYQQVFQTNLMKSQDERLRATNTILSNMKLVKLLGLELRFKSLLQSLRQTEFIWLEKLKDIWVYGGIMFWMSPIVTASIVFGSCVILGNPLTATIVFTVLSTFRVIQEPVRNVPDVLTAWLRHSCSVRHEPYCLFLGNFFFWVARGANPREIRICHGYVKWKVALSIREGR